MAESGVTIRSDSEQYSGEDISTLPPSSSSPAVILYQPPTLWSLLRGATINLFLPFVNGMMLGFGELFAHEAAFRLGWSGTRVCCNALRMSRQQEAKRLTWKWPGLSPFTTTSTPHRARDRGCGEAKVEVPAGRPHEHGVSEGGRGTNTRLKEFHTSQSYLTSDRESFVGGNIAGALGGVSCSRLRIHGGGLLTQKIYLPHISAASTFCICTYNKTESPWHISASQFTNKTIEKFTKPWLCPSSLYRLECRWTLRWPTFPSVPGPHMDA